MKNSTKKVSGKKAPRGQGAAPEGGEREVAAVWVPVAELKPWKGNPRKNDAAVQRVARSLQEYGWGAPLVVNKRNGEIVAGHTRLKAAKELGHEKVPVRFVDLTEEQARQLSVADNKLSELTDWDAPLLYEWLAEQESDIIELVGFVESDVDRILGEVMGEAQGPNDPDKEWDGMPEFEQNEGGVAYRSIHVHFRDQDAVDLFFKRLGVKPLTEKGKYLWFPEDKPVTEPTVLKSEGGQ